MIVVSNTSPINYLVLLEKIDLLPILFGSILIPEAVHSELQHEEAPGEVQRWSGTPPSWLHVTTLTAEPAELLRRLHPGEREAIALAEEVEADLILLDEKAARDMAQTRGLNVTGLIGILDEAATQGLLDLSEVVAQLQQTTFRISPTLLRWLLQRHLPTLGT